MARARDLSARAARQDMYQLLEKSTLKAELALLSKEPAADSCAKDWNRLQARLHPHS